MQENRRLDVTGNLKLKLLFLFLVPAVGMLYFSFGYVDNKFEQYRKTVYLETVSAYAETTAKLIRELQKERGLSVASLTKKHFFMEKLMRQRRRTDKAYMEYAALLRSRESFEHPRIVKRIIREFSDIDRIRENVDRSQASLKSILDYYSGLVGDLIENTGVLKSAFVSESFFYLVNGYRMLLRLAEDNGRERALISYLLETKKPDERFRRLLYRLEARSEELSRRIDEEASVVVEQFYRTRLPRPMELEYRRVKERVIYDGNYTVVTSAQWWKTATKYIDAIYAADNDVLQRLWGLKERLKEEAHRALIISIILWMIALVALYTLAMIFLKVINAYGRQVELTRQQQKLYKAFSEFTEYVIYNDNREVLLNTMCVILMQTDRFTHIWIARVEGERIVPVFTENISPALIAQEMDAARHRPLRLYEELRHVAQSGRFDIAMAGTGPSPLYAETESFGMFPVYEEDGAAYVLVAGTRSSEMLDANTIDLIGRMVGALRYAMDKIAIQHEENRMKEELAVMASAFNAHEAITITDALGNIIKVNDAFTRITGYEPEEVIGKNPSILKSGKHDREFYIEMWDAIRKEGSWKGEIYNKRKNGEIYPELLTISAVRSREGKTTHYVAHFFDITDLKAAQEQAEYRAQHDPLTELYNRQKLIEELAHLYRHDTHSGYYSAFIYFDIDGFKQINDFHTHEVGDKVLIEAAKRLKALAYEDDIVARIAGDEFAFVAADLERDETEAIKKVSILVEKIRERFQVPMEIGPHSITITFSMGIKMFPDGSKNVHEVVVDADVAMYHAKKSGKNRYRFFDDRLDLEARQFLILKNEFAGALERGELVMYYQPQLAVRSGGVRGFEAVVRWRHPQRGLLYPADFIHVTTSNRLNYELTAYVIREVCRQILAWQREWEGFDYRVAVNISGEQFNQKDFDRRIIALVEETGVDPSLLEFEIVEDTLMHDIDYSIGLIERFRAFGIRFSIDDFGTGYSSFNYLKKLPVNALKIDGSFIRDFAEGHNREVIRMIIETSHIFGLVSIAEGVENEEVLAFLKECGCDCYQGYLFSPPLPAAEIGQMHVAGRL